MKEKNTRNILFILLIVAFLLLFTFKPSPKPSPSTKLKPLSLASLIRNSKKSPEKEEIHIVYTSDENDKRAVEASVESLLRHTSSPIHIHYIGEKPLTYNQANFIPLETIATIYNLSNFVNTNNRSHNNELNTNLANFARLILPELLPNISKIMYFDADTTIICDIAPFFHSILNDGMLFESSGLAAVPREGLKGFGGHPKEDLGVSFNAGVLGMRLDIWRKNNMTETIRNITLSNQKVQRYKLGSQPPLAIAFGSDFEKLPQSWNRKADKMTLETARREEKDVRRMEMGGTRERGRGKEGEGEEEEDEVCVVHWKGAYKPWKVKKDEKQKKNVPPLWASYDVMGRAEKKERREAEIRERREGGRNITKLF